MLKESGDHRWGMSLLSLDREVEVVGEVWVQENVGHVPVEDASSIHLGALTNSLSLLTLVHCSSVLTL